MNQEGLPHDIADLIPYQALLSDWVLGALIAALVIGLATWLLLWLAKRKQKRHVDPEKKRDVLAEVVSAITKLQPSEPFIGAAQRDFFHKLSLLFREFLEWRWHFPATDLTLQELSKPVHESLALGADEKKNILEFFRLSDLIKYADREVDVGVAKTKQQEVLRWIAQMKPVPLANQEVRSVS